MKFFVGGAKPLFAHVRQNWAKPLYFCRLTLLSSFSCLHVFGAVLPVYRDLVVTGLQAL